MKLRRIRGTISTAILWSATWTVLGALFRVAGPTETGAVLVPSMVLSAATAALFPGAIGGVIFAGILVASRRRRLADFSTREFATYGVLGATVAPVIALVLDELSGPRSLSSFAPMLTQYAVSGILCSVLTLSLARRGHRAGKPNAETSIIAPATFER